MKLKTITTLSMEALVDDVNKFFQEVDEVINIKYFEPYKNNRGSLVYTVCIVYKEEDNG